MIYTLMCAIMAVIISLISLFHGNRKKSQPMSRGMNKFMAVISILVFITYMAIAATACMHGADMESLQRFGILRTIRAIQNSPIADRKASLDQQGNILIYYRFGCGDCEAVYDRLRAETAGKGNIYWVASRQSKGRELLQKYTVSEVPAGVVIQADSMYVSYVLCNPAYDKPDKTGGVQLDMDALNRLLELQKREMPFY